MKSAVTICLVPEAKQGPFVFHEGLEGGCLAAAELGFDGVEIFPESAEAFPSEAIDRLLADCSLSLAAVGTGGGWIKHKLHLCHADPAIRQRARDFIAKLIDVAGERGAPVIVGSMQGTLAGNVSREMALDWLAESLALLGDRACRHGQVVLYEPLNRYETNLFNQQAAAAAFCDVRGLDHVRLLCDLFHMNIEEAHVPQALVAVGSRIGHVHWADSNRCAVGLGHTDTRPVIAALRSIGYEGFLSAEVFPLPSGMEAARRSLESLRECAAF